MSAQELAKARRMHAEAVAAHQAASDKAQAIVERLDGIRARRDAISQNRVSGLVDPAETAEFAALAGDIEVLDKMLVQARAEAATASEQMHGRTIYYADAEQAHKRELAAVEYEALRQKTQEIEAVFCRAIGMVARAGKQLGHHTLSQSYKPSDTLHRALNLGVAPGEAL